MKVDIPEIGRAYKSLIYDNEFYIAFDFTDTTKHGNRGHIRGIICLTVGDNLLYVYHAEDFIGDIREDRKRLELL